jgi:hypothetical protein
MKDRNNQGRGLAKVSHLFLSGPEPTQEKVTIQVAARTLGVSKGTIITYLNEGLLTRIKEGGRICVSMDEVRTLGDTKRKPQVKPSVTTSAKRNKRVSVNKERDRPKRPVASFGLLESERQYLLTCKAALEAKDRELETLTFEVKTLKKNVKIQADELKGTETRLRELEKKQQKLPGEFKSTTNAHNQELLEKIQARLLKVEEEMQGLGRPWWQKFFVHLRPELSGNKGKVLLGGLALLTVLIFSGWWFSRSPNHPPPAVAEGQPSGSGAVQAPSQAVLDSELEQEQSARVVHQPSEPLNTTAAPEPEPAALDAQNAQPYTSSVEGSPSAGKRVSLWPEVDQQDVGLSSTASPYFLRAETLAATWLQVVIDERQELEYLLHPNENHTWRAIAGFRLHIGNAAGLRLYLNDQPLKPLGKNGEVVHLRLPDPSLIVTYKSEYTEPVSGP